MLTVIAAKSAGQAVWKFLTSKIGLALIAIVLLGLLQWKLLSDAHDRGVAEQAIVTADVQTKFDAYMAEDKRLDEVARKAGTDAATKQAALVSGLQEDLQAWKDKKSLVKVVLKEVVRYVSSEADAACTIPAGFVFVHNTAAQAESTGTSGTPGSFQGDADSPSGITLSAVTETIRDNYAECADRKQVIDSWQRWYHGNEEILKDYEKATAPPQ